MCARVLLAVMAWGRGIGPVLNLTALGHALNDAGADVGFLTPARFRDRIEPHFAVVSELDQPTRRDVSDGYYVDFLSFQGLDDYRLIERWIATELAAIEHFSPDVVVSDLQLTTAISAELAGIPHVGIARWTEHSRFTSSVFRRRFGSAELPPTRAWDAFNEAIARHGGTQLRAHPWELAYERSQTAICPSSPTLERELDQLGGVDFVGYLADLAVAPDDPFDAEADLKVLMYLSDKGLDVQHLIAAVEPLTRRRRTSVVVVDPTVPSALDDLPPWLQLVRRLDPLPIACADVLICLGTRGSTQEALMAGAGVVFVGSEDDDELDFTAARVADLGAGIRSPASGLAEAVERAAAPTTRAASARIGLEMLSLGGPVRAAKLVLGSQGPDAAS